jgi:4-oxalomesaconate hydratase
MLVIGAHSADFVWRAAGAIARHTGAGGEARVVALSYGERGESGELWKQPGQTVENVKRVRHAEAGAAATELGAGFECLDLGDYPLEPDRAAVEWLAGLIREFAPQVVLTHPERDPFNPDHPAAHAAVLRARLLATGGVVAAAFQTIPPPRLYAFEPHQPELSGFLPTTYLDITEVFPAKLRAMRAMAAQNYLQEYYAQRAEQRGNHARKVTGEAAIRHAEAFQQLLPRVVSEL